MTEVLKGGVPNQNCLVCRAPYVPSRWKGLVQCDRCGFVSADTNLSDSELEHIYSKDYFHGGEYLDYIEEERSLRENFRARIATLRKVAPDLASRDLFEIGCAAGFFLDEVRGAVRSASGLDLSDYAVKFARERMQVNAHKGDYLSYDLRRKFGIIAMWDTIEHLSRPDLYVAKASRDLEPGGLLALTTGDIGSLNARLRGSKWRMIHPPTHLHYFSVQSITSLLKRHGIDTVHVSHPGISRNLQSILYYVLAWRMKQSALYEFLKRQKFSRLRITVNLFDIMYIIGRKR